MKKLNSLENLLLSLMIDQLVAGSINADTSYNEKTKSNMELLILSLGATSCMELIQVTEPVIAFEFIEICKKLGVK